MSNVQADIADFLQRFSVKVLWHFSGYGKNDQEAFSILQKILSEQKLKTTERPEDVIMPSGEKRYVHPYSCTCDIPFKDLRIHTMRYGKFGIAFKKVNAIKLGHFNPVFYIHKDHYLFKHVDILLNDLDELASSDTTLSKKLTSFLVTLGTYIKRSNLTSHVVINDVNIDKTQNNNFYYEREWRSVIDWKFKEADVEAIMVANKYFNETKKFLDLINFNNVPIINYELIESL